MSNRKPPQAETTNDALAKCEAGLVGSAMIDPSVLARIAPIVSLPDFLDSGLGSLFAALQTLHEAGKPIDDFVVLRKELPRLGVPPELCTQPALVRIVGDTIHAGHAVYYAAGIAEAARLRRLLATAEELQRRASQRDADAGDIRQWLETQIARLDRNQPHDMRLIGDLAADAIAEIDAAANAPTRHGLMTGIERLDAAAGAVMPGEVVVIAARTGFGKTSLATQIAEYNAERSRPSLIVSLEMKGKELALRMLSGRSGVDSRDLRSSRVSQQQRERLQAESEPLQKIPLRVWGPASAALAEIRGIARYAKATSGLQLLVVDYIGLVRPSADEKRLPRYEQVSAVSAGLKSIAKELDVVILALAQLNREADGNEPKLSHLRESGSIEQDADAVWLIHHPPTTGAAAGQSVYATGCSLIIAKHRHGETGRVQLLWHPSETRFSSPSPF